MGPNQKGKPGNSKTIQGKMESKSSDETGGTQDVFKILVKKRSLIFAMTGLKGAGKSTILSKLGIGRVQALESLVAGTSIEDLKYQGNGNMIRFVSWDGSVPDDGFEDTRRDVISSLSSKDNTLSLVFVIDRKDFTKGAKRDEVAIYLRQILCGRRMPVLVLVNKSDQSGAISPDPVFDRSFPDERDQYCIYACNALTGDGIHEAFRQFTKKFQRYFE